MNRYPRLTRLLLTFAAIVAVAFLWRIEHRSVFERGFRAGVEATIAEVDRQTSELRNR